MSDARLREMERRARETMLPADRDLLAAERMRAGMVTRGEEGLAAVALERDAAPIEASLLLARVGPVAIGPRLPRRLRRRKGPSACADLLQDAVVEAVRGVPDGRPGLEVVVVHVHPHGARPVQVDAVQFYRRGVPLVRKRFGLIVVFPGDTFRCTYRIDGRMLWVSAADRRAGVPLPEPFEVADPVAT